MRERQWPATSHFVFFSETYSLTYQCISQVNCFFFCLVLQQQLASYQTEKNRLSLTLEERTEQERAEQSKTLERLEQELVIREKAEAAAAEAERERSVLAVDLKDMQQKLERLKQEYNALQDKVRNGGRR